MDKKIRPAPLTSSSVSISRTRPLRLDAGPCIVLKHCRWPYRMLPPPSWTQLGSPGNAPRAVVSFGLCQVLADGFGSAYRVVLVFLAVVS